MWFFCGAVLRESQRISYQRFLCVKNNLIQWRRRAKKNEDPPFFILFFSVGHWKEKRGRAEISGSESSHILAGSYSWILCLSTFQCVPLSCLCVLSTPVSLFRYLSLLIRIYRDFTPHWLYPSLLDIPFLSSFGSAAYAQERDSPFLITFPCKRPVFLYSLALSLHLFFLFFPLISFFLHSCPQRNWLLSEKESTLSFGWPFYAVLKKVRF